MELHIGDISIRGFIGSRVKKGTDGSITLYIQSKNNPMHGSLLLHAEEVRKIASNTVRRVK